MKFPAFDYFRPQTVDEALSLIADGEASILAGGQSLSPMMSFRVARPQCLVDISRLAELRASTLEADGTLVIGAAMTHAWIEDGVLPGAIGATFARVASGIAYRAIRNRGTIGGSVVQADPAADWPCLLMALDASVVLRRTGESRTLPLRDFMVGHLQTSIEPGELLTALRVPFRPGARHGFAKFTRKLGEFSEAIAAARIDAHGVTLALGALEVPPLALAIDPAALRQPIPIRLTGSSLFAAVDSALRAAAVSDAQSYHHHLAVITGCRALQEAAGA